MAVLFLHKSAALRIEVFFFFFLTTHAGKSTSALIIIIIIIILIIIIIIIMRTYEVKLVCSCHQTTAVFLCRF